MVKDETQWGVARLVKELLEHTDENDGSTLHQAIYEVDPPLEGHTRIVISAVHNQWVHEVMAFPVDENDMIEDYLDLGVLRGSMSHLEFLNAHEYTSWYWPPLDSDEPDQETQEVE